MEDQALVFMSRKQNELW